MFIGIGYDTHRFVKDRKLIMGGIEIPFERGLSGHSDADVLTHAICDAILGAAGLEDIGHHFPNTSDEFKNISSLILLENVMKMLNEKKFIVINIDSVIIAEKPKFFPFINKMKKNYSKILKIGEGKIGIKGTTTEGLGFEGQGLGISAQAIALIENNF